MPQFGEPILLWLLVVPAALLVLWVRECAARRADARRFGERRQVPVRERLPVFGEALSSLCVILAVAVLVFAVARPRVVTSLVRTGGVDLVVLLDGSASMHVADVVGNRWQRSIRFLRTLGDSLSWQQDRMALTLFAHIAAPQIRLTNDPNTFFFFLDHLEEGPPFRLEDDTTWDTNIALGIQWGLRVIDKDTELRGPSPNARVFVLITDGQAWSGVVEEAISTVRARGFPVFVVGVGTLRGGVIPDPKAATMIPAPPPIRSVLDRPSLNRIATLGGGQYLELDRGRDTDVANRIIDAARRRAESAQPEARVQEVYWPFLVVAAGLIAASVLFTRGRPELWIQLAGGLAALVTVSALL